MCQLNKFYRPQGKAERLQWGCAVSRCFSLSFSKWASSLEKHFCRRASRRVRLAARVPSGLQVYGSARLFKLQLLFRLPLWLLPPPWHLHAPPGPTSSLPVRSPRNPLYTTSTQEVCAYLWAVLFLFVCVSAAKQGRTPGTWDRSVTSGWPERGWRRRAWLSCSSWWQWLVSWHFWQCVATEPFWSRPKWIRLGAGTQTQRRFWLWSSAQQQTFGPILL